MHRLSFDVVQSGRGDHVSGELAENFSQPSTASRMHITSFLSFYRYFPGYFRSRRGRPDGGRAVALRLEHELLPWAHSISVANKTGVLVGVGSR